MSWAWAIPLLEVSERPGLWGKQKEENKCGIYRDQYSTLRANSAQTRCSRSVQLSRGHEFIGWEETEEVDDLTSFILKTNANVNQLRTESDKENRHIYVKQQNFDGKQKVFSKKMFISEYSSSTRWFSCRYNLAAVFKRYFVRWMWKRGRAEV